ncbi:MAG: GNAT family N-acetyltransferase [Lewinellaceae bacterium]|nr:GNAT family N-acetyltransferase [Lewinellaceae bacterium]
MIANVTYSYPDPEFWAEYVELWNNSLHQPVFKSPNYIRYLADRYRDSLAIFRYMPAGKLKAAIFFRKEGQEYRLLTDVKADHNFFVIHKECTQEEIYSFFKLFLAAVKKEKWSVSLLVQPSWASYADTFTLAAQASGLYWNISERSVCPILEEESPEKLFENLNSSRELRYRVNRIKSQLNGEFEIFRGDEDLDNWLTRFTELHGIRWNNTNTPSRYTTEEGIKFLKNCLLSWIQDNTLVRFSVKVKGERIGFVICLIQQNSLIHHSTAYDDTYYKYSPGKALILVIAEWMKNNGLNILDFGEGKEEYKYSYTNKEHVLNQISISNYSNFSFILKSKLKNAIREKMNGNPRLKQFIKEKLKPIALRSKV